MVRIDEEYILNANESCYTLEKVGTIQDPSSKNYGKETKIIQGYYTTVENALNGYLKAKTREYVSKETENTLKELIQIIKSFQEEIKTNIENKNK